MLVSHHINEERGEKDLRLRKEDTNNGGEVMQVEEKRLQPLEEKKTKQ